MKILQCNKCNRKQSAGKFCLDCGSQLNEIITSEVKFKTINTSRTADQLKRDVRIWLMRIGVQQPDIKINTSGNEAKVEYILGKTLYAFSSHMQDNVPKNLAAVEQFLHYRVLGIERGIETVEQAFAGYEALPDYTNKDSFNPYEVLGFKEKVDIEEARSKFKKLVKLYHPDLNPDKNTQDEFQRLKKAMDMIEGGK